MKLNKLPFFLLLITSSLWAQHTNYAVSTIPDSLKQNANAVVRLSQITIEVTAQNSMTINSKIAVTVLNELGLRNLDLTEGYDKNKIVKNMQLKETLTNKLF